VLDDTTTFIASPSLAKDVLDVNNSRAGSHIVLDEECSGSKEQAQMKETIYFRHNTLNG